MKTLEILEKIEMLLNGFLVLYCAVVLEFVVSVGGYSNAYKYIGDYGLIEYYKKLLSLGAYAIPVFLAGVVFAKREEVFDWILEKINR